MDQTSSDRVTFLRRLLAVVAIVSLGDYALAHHSGYSGIACFGIGLAAFLYLGIALKKPRFSVAAITITILLSSLRLIWQGNVPLVIFLLLQLSLLAMALHEAPIRFPSLGGFLIRLLPNSCRTFLHEFSPQVASVRPSTISVLSIVVPMAACMLFSVFFVLANPDLAVSFGQSISQALTSVGTWLSEFSFMQLAIWVCTTVFALGAMAPLIRCTQVLEGKDVVEDSQASVSYWYVPIRNSLYAVNVLFVVYLGFEMLTLWFREFPVGFYYSGYAHQGAFWLTVALATTSASLSCMFQSSLLADPRIQNLKNLAWLWTGLNLLLAVSVYHRLWIYIDFNGMTRMRMVGFFGISCVVAGLLLCAYKIHSRQSFRWLIESQAWALAVTLYIFSITPTDWICHQYNVRRILAGDLPPVVQITSHPVSPEGWLVVQRLVRSTHPIIRDGIIAMTIDRMENAISDRYRIAPEDVLPSPVNWRQFQLASHRLRLEQLATTENESNDENVTSIIELFKSNVLARKAAIESLRKFAFQYY